ncbi:MAG: hypothetical protein H6556_00155 [Lewinellaceae bacterium]|nr:hypothetical protein [Lewinellaceae bacterium]
MENNDPRFELDAFQVFHTLMHNDSSYPENNEKEGPFLSVFSNALQEYILENHAEELVFADRGHDPGYFEQKRLEFFGYPKDRFPLPDFFIAEDKLFHYFHVQYKKEQKIFPQWLLTPEDLIYAICFVYKIRHLPSGDLKEFLQYHQHLSVTDFDDFWKRIRLDYQPLLKDKLWEYLDYIYPSIQKPPLPNTTTSSDFEMTRAQQVLLLYFLFESEGINLRHEGIMPMATKLLHALTGTPFTNLSNSPFYKFIGKAPVFKSDQYLLEDLKVVRGYLENLVAKKALSELDTYLREAKDELGSTDQ